MAATKCNRNDEWNAWFWILWWTKLLFDKLLSLFDIILSRLWISLFYFVSFYKLQILEPFRNYDTPLRSTCWCTYILVGTSWFCWYNCSNGFRQKFLRSFIFKISFQNIDKHNRYLLWSPSKTAHIDFSNFFLTIFHIVNEKFHPAPLMIYLLIKQAGGHFFLTLLIDSGLLIY